ncbi:hypothetical protein AB0C69_33835 [Actinomadura sp. NPDC048032]|uniref:hypothetical protein n=1 Tax=Actinomadura sp. NPDC048032 TaxID=3155747 RepID=UPI00340BCC31
MTSPLELPADPFDVFPAGRTERRRVRVACYRLASTAADDARGARLDQLLGAMTVTR